MVLFYNEAALKKGKLETVIGKWMQLGTTLISEKNQVHMYKYQLSTKNMYSRYCKMGSKCSKRKRNWDGGEEKQGRVKEKYIQNSYTTKFY